MKFFVVLSLLWTSFTTALGADTPRALTATERLQPEHLKATHEARERFARERQPLLDHGLYEDFRAVIHVHAEDSDHTKGTRAELLAAAKKAGVSVVMFTDHRGPKPETWHGLRDGVLFFAGSEVGDGSLLFPGFDADHKPVADGELRFLSHVEERYDAVTTNFIGMEICNRHTDAKIDQTTQAAVLAASADPDKWRTFVENFKTYPDEFFAAGTDYRAEIFAKWDREIRQRPFTGIAANDAHQNTIFNDVTFDPYEVSFRNLSTHILARALTEPEIREALRAGHAYVSQDWLCDPTGFSFSAVNNLGVFSMGDTALMTGTTRVVGLTPLAARLKLIRNGKVVEQTIGTNLTYRAEEAGAYRLEAWLEVDGEERPWIYSNPVYLREPTLAELSMNLPSYETTPSVEIKRDFVYTDGKPEDAAKHKLDLYVPKGKNSTPVFLFLHGGAWRTGDRSLYLPLGNRFAREGVLTVIPSYRLAPKNPHPAQIEDAAAAFAWTVQHVAEYGGDTNRIYVGGHSAGGHLAALLTLNEKYLKAHQLSPQAIRGVIALSGVYNIAVGDIQTRVFGEDKTVRADASPIFHVHNPAPPFLVTYCEWDYPTLPAQAKLFHAALRRAGVKSELAFTPKQSHISEMIAITRNDDVTAKAVLNFIR